ncbi:WD domain, G-beta repeat protein [Trichuris suis]|nr:WD domain, G-beta repeat protein [Trichuris suis]
MARYLEAKRSIYSAQLYITADRRFSSLAQLVHFHSREAEGLACSLLYPAPKKDIPSCAFSLSPSQPDEWEVDRTEVVMKQRLASSVQRENCSPKQTSSPMLGQRAAMKSFSRGTGASPVLAGSSKGSFRKEGASLTLDDTASDLTGSFADDEAVGGEVLRSFSAYRPSDRNRGQGSTLNSNVAVVKSTSGSTSSSRSRYLRSKNSSFDERSSSRGGSSSTDHLQEQMMRQVVGHFSTIPKSNKIDAYFESLSEEVPTTTSSVSYHREALRDINLDETAVGSSSSLSSSVFGSDNVSPRKQSSAQHSASNSPSGSSRKSKPPDNRCPPPKPPLRNLGHQLHPIQNGMPSFARSKSSFSIKSFSSAFSQHKLANKRSDGYLLRNRSEVDMLRPVSPVPKKTVDSIFHVEEACQTDDMTTGWKKPQSCSPRCTTMPNRLSAVAKHVRNVDRVPPVKSYSQSFANELHDTIRSLRHVPLDNGASPKRDSISPEVTSGGGIVERAKIRQLNKASTLPSQESPEHADASTEKLSSASVQKTSAAGKEDEHVDSAKGDRSRNSFQEDLLSRGFNKSRGQRLSYADCVDESFERGRSSFLVKLPKAVVRPAVPPRQSVLSKSSYAAKSKDMFPSLEELDADFSNSKLKLKENATEHNLTLPETSSNCWEKQLLCQTQSVSFPLCTVAAHDCNNKNGKISLYDKAHQLMPPPTNLRRSESAQSPIGSRCTKDDSIVSTRMCTSANNSRNSTIERAFAAEVWSHGAPVLPYCGEMRQRNEHNKSSSLTRDFCGVGLNSHYGDFPLQDLIGVRRKSSSVEMEIDALASELSKAFGRAVCRRGTCWSEGDTGCVESSKTTTKENPTGLHMPDIIRSNCLAENVTDSGQPLPVRPPRLRKMQRKKEKTAYSEKNNGGFDSESVSSGGSASLGQEEEDVQSVTSGKSNLGHAVKKKMRSVWHIAEGAIARQQLSGKEESSQSEDEEVGTEGNRVTQDDRYFISGSLDGKIRLWLIPEKKVVNWNELDEGQLVTAVTFVKNGELVAVGTYNGRCIFYTSDLLITCNDSRIRLYDVRDLTLVCKYRGFTNRSSQIRARFSHNGQFIIAGSEDSMVYMWKTRFDSNALSLPGRKDRSRHWESIKAHQAVVTSALFAPKPDVIFAQIERARRRLLNSDQAEANDEDERCRKSQLSQVSIDTKSVQELIVSADFSGVISVFLNRPKVVAGSSVFLPT